MVELEQIRSFIAVELPEELRLELGRFEAYLKSDAHPRVKWVNPDSIHLTLKFLGNIGADRVGEIMGAIEEASLEVPPFQLKVKDSGVFPSVKRARVAWVGLSGDTDRLIRLQQSLESGLERLSFAAESKAFTPHLTLARLQERSTPEERQRFGRLIAEAVFEAATIINVTTVSLMKSHLTRQGAVYSRLGMVSLKG